MKIHEYQGKAILREFGVPVPNGDVADTPAQAQGDRGEAGRQGRGQGAGARGRARQGRRREAGRRSRGGRGGGETDPRHDAEDAADPARGHQGPQGAGRGGLADRRRALPLDDARPRPGHARRHGLAGRRHGDRGGRRHPSGEDRPRVDRPGARPPGLPGAQPRVRPRAHRRPVQGGRGADPQPLPRLPREGLLAGRDQPARGDARRAGAGARRQAQLRRQRALPPPGDRGPARHQRGDAARRRGVEVRPQLHQAGRERRLHGQRRRARHGHHGHHQARGRRARQLPRRGRRRLAGADRERLPHPVLGSDASRRCSSTSSAASSAATGSPRASSRR